MIAFSRMKIIGGKISPPLLPEHGRSVFGSRIHLDPITGEPVFRIHEPEGKAYTTLFGLPVSYMPPTLARAYGVMPS